MLKKKEEKLMIQLRELAIRSSQTYCWSHFWAFRPLGRENMTKIYVNLIKQLQIVIKRHNGGKKQIRPCSFQFTEFGPNFIHKNNLFLSILNFFPKNTSRFFFTHLELPNFVKKKIEEFMK